MTDYLALPLGEHAPDVVAAVIETSQRRITRYDRDLHIFHPVRPLYSPVHYPGNCGFIPQTAGASGDPLNILMLSDTPYFPGCISHARPIGLLAILDHGIQHETILACATRNLRLGRMRNYTDAQPTVLREIEHFLSVYRAPVGKRAKVLGWRDRKAAQESIRAGHARFVSGAAKTVHET